MNHTEIEPPPRSLTLMEGRALFEGLSLFAAWPWLAMAARGDGRPVVLAPGYGAGDASMAPLYRYLEWLDYDVHHWGLGKNRGKVSVYVEELRARVRELHGTHRGATVTLIGWSLGGVVMREVARLEPDFVREVITLGTPIKGGPAYTLLSRQIARGEHLDLDHFEIEAHERNMQGINCPVTSIYSKTDGVVPWRSSIDDHNPQACNLRVPGSHLGLAFNPCVLDIIAASLAGRR
ncbi:MAG: alpha/beta fold hydrolase [Xanthomonadales bacterium]|nr:alpha/beta fold hydrolase [Xanthomonadales bacterium]